MRGERGITLVALVVTIVVLLILAGITIAYVLADDGIFAKAEEAALESTKGVIMDYASNAQATFLINSYDADDTNDNPLDVVDDNFPTDYVVASDATTPLTSATSDGSSVARMLSGACTVTYKNNVYTVTYTNGVPKITNVTAVTPDGEDG